METYFRGRFEAKLDSKGRVAIPSGIRSIFPSSESSIVVTNSQFQGMKCLDLYLSEEWENLEKRIRRLSPLESAVQSFERFYLSGGQSMTPDGQGRVLLPQDLRNYASLSQGVIFVGMGRKLEIWNEKTWSKLHADLANNYEDTLARLAELDKGYEGE